MGKKEYGMIKALGAAALAVGFGILLKNEAPADNPNGANYARQIFSALEGKNTAGSFEVNTNFYDGKIICGATASRKDGIELLVVEQGISKGERNLYFDTNADGIIDAYSVKVPRSLNAGTNGKPETLYSERRLKFPGAFQELYTNELERIASLMGVNTGTNASK